MFLDFRVGFRLFFYVVSPAFSATPRFPESLGDASPRTLRGLFALLLPCPQSYARQLPAARSLIHSACCTHCWRSVLSSSFSVSTRFSSCQSWKSEDCSAGLCSEAVVLPWEGRSKRALAPARINASATKNTPTPITHF